MQCRQEEQTTQLQVTYVGLIAQKLPHRMNRTVQKPQLDKLHFWKLRAHRNPRDTALTSSALIISAASPSIIFWRCVSTSCKSAPLPMVLGLEPCWAPNACARRAAQPVNTIARSEAELVSLVGNGAGGDEAIALHCWAMAGARCRNMLQAPAASPSRDLKGLLTNE